MKMVYDAGTPDKNLKFIADAPGGYEQQARYRTAVVGQVISADLADSVKNDFQKYFN